MEKHIEKRETLMTVCFRLCACDSIAKNEPVQRNFTLKNCVQLRTLYVNVMQCNDCTFSTGI